MLPVNSGFPSWNFFPLYLKNFVYYSIEYEVAAEKKKKKKENSVWKVFILPTFLKDIFADYGIWIAVIFILKNFKAIISLSFSFHWFYWEFICYNCCFFEKLFLFFIILFFLLLVFCSFIFICSDTTLFLLMMLELQHFLNLFHDVFHLLGEVLSWSLHVLFKPFPLSSFSGTSITYMLILLTVPSMSHACTPVCFILCPLRLSFE